MCSNVFTHLWASKFSASEAKVADRVASVGDGVASVTGVDKVKPGDNNTVCEKTLHTSRKSQYLYFYGKPNDLSGLRTPTNVDLKTYNLFLFRVFKDNGFMPLELVVLDQTSLDEQLSKGLLGWANKDPHRFAYGVQSETGENLLIIGDTVSTPSLINGASQSFTGVYDDTFSSKYSLHPAAKSITKVTFSNQTFPNKFIGNLDFDFEVEPYKSEVVAREPLRSSIAKSNNSFDNGVFSIVINAFQKLAIAGVVGSVTTFGMSDVAMAAGSYEEAWIKWKSELSAAKEQYFKFSEGMSPRTKENHIVVEVMRKEIEFLESSEPKPADFVKPESKLVDVSLEEGKHNAPNVKSEIPSGDAKLSIPEDEEFSPRELLQSQRDEKVEPNDSISVIPNGPDSPRQPDPIVQAPNQEAGAGLQQGNNGHPGDLSEILNNHEAVQEAEARARDRIRAGISLWQYAMGHGSVEPTWAGYLLGDHPEINSWSQFFFGGGNNPSLSDYVMGSDTLSDVAKEKRVDIIWYGIYAATAAAVTYTVYYHGYNIMMDIYNWYHDLHPGVVVRRAGFLNRNELVEWWMENPYERLSPYGKLWYDLFEPQYDPVLYNGWAGKAHMFEVLPTFERAAEIAKALPYALRSFLVDSSPVLAVISKATNVSPIKIAAVGAAAAAQSVALAVKTSTGQWLSNMIAGVFVSVTSSIYQTVAAIAGIFTTATSWLAYKLAGVTAVTLDSVIDWGIKVAENVGVITPEQAERLRQARNNFNRVADNKIKEYWGYFKEALGIAGAIASNSGKKVKDGSAVLDRADKPFPWDALLILSVIGLIAYWLYNQRRTRSLNEGTGKKDV